ncbi:MAG: COQ9 family protein [Henriciella sp.]|nr:COQ9 family protein [Henriciella sp.]
MRTPSEALKDRWLDAALVHINVDGWTERVLQNAAEEADLSENEQALAAPNGVNDLIDHFFERATDEMLERLSTENLEQMRVHERVAAGLRAWLDSLDANREAVRRAAARGLLPWGAGAATRRVWKIADAIWEAAGDTATDYNRHTKRALLSATIPSIVLYWLNHDDDDAVDAFIMRRLKQAMQLGRAGGKVVGPVLSAIEKFRKSRSDRSNSF